jgi:hypothetical protein
MIASPRSEDCSLVRSSVEPDDRVSGYGQQPVPDADPLLARIQPDEDQRNDMTADVREDGAKAGSPERSFIARLSSLPFLR